MSAAQQRRGRSWRAQKESRAGKVGILMAFPESDRDIQARVTAFRQELWKVGWSEGVNLHIDERWPSDDMGRVRTDAAELLNLKPDVILVSGRRAVAVLQQQTRSIPVVFAGIGDPVLNLGWGMNGSERRSNCKRCCHRLEPTRASCLNSTARWCNGSIRISACFIAAPKN